MKHFAIKILIFLSISMILFSCTKDMYISENCQEWRPLSFRTGTLELKSELKEEVTDFSVRGFDAGGSEFFPLTDVSAGTVYDQYKWKTGKSYTFFGYANLPGTGANVSITSNTMDLDYSISPDCSNQKDILLGFYTGDGGGLGCASMVFSHILASVQFTVGTLVGISKITGIYLCGVYTSARFTMDANGNYSVKPESSAQNIIFQAMSTDIPSEDNKIGSPFLVIPGYTGRVEVSVITEDGENKSLFCNTVLYTYTGETTICELNYTDKIGLTINTSVEDWIFHPDSVLTLITQDN